MGTTSKAIRQPRATIMLNTPASTKKPRKYLCLPILFCPPKYARNPGYSGNIHGLVVVNKPSSNDVTARLSIKPTFPDKAQWPLGGFPHP